MKYDNLNEEELYELAAKRVTAKKDFRTHLAVYIIVNIGLFAIYALTSWGGYPWFIWPLFGWGIGLAFHFFNMLSELKGTDKNRIDNEIDKLKKM